MKKLITALALAIPVSTFAQNTPSVDITVSGGAFFNDKLKRTAGRENQLKLTEVILGVSGEYNGYKYRIEGVPLGDEMYVDKSDSAYNDIYTNLGTSLYYYGDFPVREAWVGKDFGNFGVTFGRMTTAIAGPEFYQFAPYSPHSVILNTGLLNGVRVGYRKDSLEASIGVLWGRDRPCFDGQCYLEGALDIQEKGNNTPVIELYVVGEPTDFLSVGFGGIYNKTGSAPGRFNSGKHNDTRAMAFADIHLWGYKDWSVDLYGQYSYYLLGLTESGVQGVATPNESYDIERQGYFVSPSVSYKNYSVRYTYESLDRMDANAFQNVARFDKNHPVNDATEDRHILSAGWSDGTLDIQAHYTTEAVDYYSNTGDEFGVTFSWKM